MDVFTIDITLNELVFIRQALEIVSVSGKDAKFLAALQVKVEREISDAQQYLQQEEDKKKQALQELVVMEQKNNKPK